MFADAEWSRLVDESAARREVFLNHLKENFGGTEAVGDKVVAQSRKLEDLWKQAEDAVHAYARKHRKAMRRSS